MSESLRTIAALLGLVPAGVAVVSAPPQALMAITVLGAFLGSLAGTGVAVVRGRAAHAWLIGLAVAGVATESGLALAGVLVALGPASVAVLPVLFALAGLTWWVDCPDQVRAAIGLETEVGGRYADSGRPIKPEGRCREY